MCVLESIVAFKAMFTLYLILKRSVAETDPVQCEQEQVLRYVAGITSFQNRAKKWSCCGAEIVPNDQKLYPLKFLQRSVSLSGTVRT